jgi:hypothetical protein
VSTVSAQPERERILDAMEQAMDAADARHAQAASGDARSFGPAPMRELAEAALQALEQPNRGSSPVTPCNCGQSGYAKDPHQPGCPHFAS